MSNSRYGHSTFLRTSAVYGSNQSTVFGETGLSSQLRKANVDRSAVGGPNTAMMSTYQAQSHSLMQSRNNSPARTATATNNSPSRAYHVNNPSSLFTNTTRQAPPNNATHSSPLRSSSYHQQQQQSSPARGGGGGGYMYGGGSSSNNNTFSAPAAGVSSGASTPRGRRGCATPERGRSPNPITGENYGAGPSSHYSAARGGGGGGHYGHQQPQQNQYYISNNNSRTGSPVMTGSRTSSIGRSSSVGSAYGRHNGHTADHQQQQPYANYNSNNSRYNGPSSSAAAAGASSASIRRAGGEPTSTAVGGKGRAATPTRRSDSPFALHTDVAPTSSAARNNTNNAAAPAAGTPTSVTRTNSGIGMGVRRAVGTINQSYSSFHISQCAPAPNNNGTNSPSRRQSPARVDPITMQPAGVRTPRERFDESPRRIPGHRGTKEAQTALFAGSDVASLIFNKNVADSVNASTNNSAARSGCQTPERIKSGVRRVEPPNPQQKNGLWLRTKNKDDVVYLGVKGRGLPPPDNQVDETVVLSHKIMPQKSNIESAACKVVGEEKTHKKLRHNPIPVKPYHGFVIPPFRVDKDTLSEKITKELEPEVFMEPFGTGYQHRRHFDPKDSVKEDIMHSNLAPTVTPRPRQGTSLIEGKGTLEPSRDVLNLSKYTSEELGEKMSRHNLMMGPPAFVPEEVKPYSANTSYRPQKMGSFNSPTNVSHLSFGTSAHVQRSMMDSPMRTSTPRGPKTGVYSPSRNAPRPF